jgi:multidrug efflux pump subunit AcrB
MGTTVIGGMLAASLLGIFLIPATYVVVKRISGTPWKGASEA